MKAAVLDDWLELAKDCIDWSPLASRIDGLDFFSKAFVSEDEAARALADYEIVLAMRDRTAFPKTLLDRLPKLKLLAFSGLRVPNFDIGHAQKRGVTVCFTPLFDNALEMTGELALSLMMAAAKKTANADASMRAGRFQEGIPFSILLHGKTLGIAGLGRIGSLMARYGQALGMKLIAWSPNMTAEKAAAAGAELVSKDELFSRSDIVTLHIVLSDRSRGMVGARELGLMKPGAILINTSRGPLVQEAALIESLSNERIFAAIDVYDKEPLPADHPLRRLKNTVLSPHMGISTQYAYATFYNGLMEDAIAYLDGKPIRVCPPAA